MFACNAYIDEQAPWALRKTDPERMETVLATLYICIAVLAVGDPPGHPRERRPAARRDGRRAELRDFDGDPRPLVFAAGRKRFPAGAAARRCFRGSNCRRRRRRRDADRQPLPPQLRRPGRTPGRSARQCARRRGVAGFLNISTRQREWDEIIGARRARARRLGERRRPSARGRRASRPRRCRAGRSAPIIRG